MSDDTGDSGLVHELRDRIKQLEAENRAAKQLETDLEDARLNDAFHKADLTSLNEAQRQAILAITDEDTPEAFRAAVSELGIGGVTFEDAAALDRLNATEAGGSPTSPPDLNDRLLAAGSPEEVLTVMAEAGYRPDF